MKVDLKTTAAGPNVNLQPGIHDLHEDFAGELIKSGHAVEPGQPYDAAQREKSLAKAALATQGGSEKPGAPAASEGAASEEQPPAADLNAGGDQNPGRGTRRR